MVILSAINWVENNPWVLTILFGFTTLVLSIVTLVLRYKSYKIKKQTSDEEKRKFNQEQTEIAKAGFKVKTALDRYKQHVYELFKEIDFT